jgi:predicted AlkP superfamily phosphohydrolase/phosphomutase
MVGSLISCFITPGPDQPYTFPSELAAEVEALVGEYLFDVEFRTENRDALLSRLYEMTERRFIVLKHLLRTRPWDFAMCVEIGLDRVHHAFWKFFDQEHDKYVAGNPYEHVVEDYYRFLDAKIGELLEGVDKDTAVVIISDHGMKRMKGAFCINEWLIDQGYLVLKSRSPKVTSLEEADVDWPSTRAWAWGGYYARVFLNVAGREPTGVVKSSEYAEVRSTLAEKICQIRDPQGKTMATRVYPPETLYRECQGDYPDLMVYFDDLYWRAAGTLGHVSYYLSENDTGPDDSVHDYEGVFILSHPAIGTRRHLGRIDILDVAPTLLQILDEPCPPSMEGRPVELP